MLAEQERSTTLRSALEESVAAAQAEMPTLEIAIGPEGGWAPEEEALFDANGWRAVSLGPRILRAETAAINGAGVGSFVSGVVMSGWPRRKSANRPGRLSSPPRRL